MRITCRANTQYLSTSHQSFEEISRIIQSSNMYHNSKMVFDMRQASRADGNLASVYAAMSYYLKKSNNSLFLGPKDYQSIKVALNKDLLGYYCTWEEFLENVFWSGGTKVHAFDPGDYTTFKSYLLNGAFRSDWKGLLPVALKLEVKRFLRSLYHNASIHGKRNEPIFISSSFRDQMLRFTIVDCGEGFLKRVKKADDSVITERQAIRWAFRGNSVDADRRKGTLKQLGEFCIANGGELIVVSGCASVTFGKNGHHESHPLPAPFRGTIINLSVKIDSRNFSS